MAPRILTDKFLDKIAKRLTAASEEFAVEGLFQLIEENFLDSATFFHEQNPFTGEPINTTESNVVISTPNTKTSFKAELSIVTEEDLHREGIGSYPVGTIYCVINSDELESLGLTQERIKKSLGITINEPVTINKYGKVLTTRTGTYEVSGILPFILRDRLLEITVFLNRADDRV